MSSAESVSSCAKTVPRMGVRPPSVPAVPESASAPSGPLFSHLACQSGNRRLLEHRSHRQFHIKHPPDSALLTAAPLASALSYQKSSDPLPPQSTFKVSHGRMRQPFCTNAPKAVNQTWRVLHPPRLFPSKPLPARKFSNPVNPSRALGMASDLMRPFRV